MLFLAFSTKEKGFSSFKFLLSNFASAQHTLANWNLSLSQDLVDFGLNVLQDFRCWSSPRLMSSSFSSSSSISQMVCCFKLTLWRAHSWHFCNLLVFSTASVQKCFHSAHHLWLVDYWQALFLSVGHLINAHALSTCVLVHHPAHTTTE